MNAPILKRFFAFVIDLLMLNFFILFPFQGVLLQGLSGAESFEALLTAFDHYSTTNLVIMALFISFVSILYFVIFERKLGQTPGKMILKIFVISEEKEFRLWQAWVRSLFVVLVFPFILLWFIEPFVVFFNHENKRLLEMLSKTKTVEVHEI